MLSIDAWLDEKPYREVYDGAIHEKVSPQRAHGVVALQIGTLLGQWAERCGSTAVELRVYLAPGITLVPDVAFISDQRLLPLSAEERERPPFAPDLVVEVRSPEDRPANIRRKTELYLAYGALLVLNVDPSARTVVVSTAAGEHMLHIGDVISHPSFTGLQIPVAAIFAPLDRLS
jgi:Uma2 family endonuclease